MLASVFSEFEESLSMETKASELRPQKIKAFSLSGIGQTLQKVVLWLIVYFFGYYNLDIRWSILLLGIWYLANTYYQTKNETKARGVHVQPAATISDKKIFSQDLPAWVLHPDTQRAEWFNKILAQVWPHLDGFLKQVLKNVEEDPQLKERLGGYHIRSLKFPHVSLGHVPPRLGGVKFHEASHRDEIILDLSLQYAGDLLISMEAILLDEKLPPAKASIRNLTLTSTQLRIHLRPLLTGTLKRYIFFQYERNSILYSNFQISRSLDLSPCAFYSRLT